MKKRKMFKAIVAIFIIFIGIILLIKFRDHLFIQWNIERLQRGIEGLGIWGVLVFIGIAAIRPFLFFPNVVIFIVGGLIYGTFLGSIAALIGVMIAFSLSFWLGSKFQDLVKKIVGERYIIKLQSIQDKEIIRKLFVMRVTPGFPIDPISYGAGLVGISYEKFFVGSLLGITPKVILYTFLGDTINNVFSIQTIIVYVLLLLLAIVPTIFFKTEI
ncbi:TVP38/TMEM64 family protein [Natronincola ferrireducens]|uniref:TVP38/TMEM64 family membrane protein n=1 Tax=Natronincola ferrireducens TaxID=393762 RepID=A0A1G8WRX5_9FIRM|nr:VTT domain-containing protein [Natronincola ferrireducens]SDJ80350.1 Uncharacterized membrane protein YdjX, TVP38/TMEM64 family, SNARE-associated domain [Natronincola ferrireducens]